MASRRLLHVSRGHLRTLIKSSENQTNSLKPLLLLRPFSTSQDRPQDSPPDTPSNTKSIDIPALLSKPTWSIQSLIPPPQAAEEDHPITPTQLRHLLRLSALPKPSSAEEENSMLATLSAQLHFVNQIRSVDASGVEPLRAIRDESALAEKEGEIGVEEMKAALGREEVVGKHVKRIRRREDGKKDEIVKDAPVGWSPLDAAGRKVGRYFVVEKEGVEGDGKEEGG